MTGSARSGGASAVLAQPAEMRAVLVRAVMHHCPPELRGQREDLAHTAWLRIIERQSGEDPGALEPSYLWRVAYTVVIDELRRRSARQAQLQALTFASQPVAPGPELGAEIRNCLERLPTSRQLPVILHLQGFRNAEVGTALRMGEKRAENLVYRGLEQLRRCLSGKGFTR